MKGKYMRSMVIMGLLVLSMVVTEVEGWSCKSDYIIGYSCFFPCVSIPGNTESTCASLCKCKLGMAEKGVEVTPAGSMNEYYCKLGCASSVCNDITTGFKTGPALVVVSGEGEEVKLAVEHCNKACSEICNNKGVEVVTA